MRCVKGAGDPSLAPTRHPYRSGAPGAAVPAPIIRQLRLGAPARLPARFMLFLLLLRLPVALRANRRVMPSPHG
jgi:hypothetical protein